MCISVNNRYKPYAAVNLFGPIVILNEKQKGAKSIELVVYIKKKKKTPQ